LPDHSYSKTWCETAVEVLAHLEPSACVTASLGTLSWLMKGAAGGPIQCYSSSDYSARHPCQNAWRGIPITKRQRQNAVRDGCYRVRVVAQLNTASDLVPPVSLFSSSLPMYDCNIGHSLPAYFGDPFPIYLQVRSFPLVH
jgi:hypothetical protein